METTLTLVNTMDASAYAAACGKQMGSMTCLESKGLQLECAPGKAVQFIQLEGSSLQAGL